MQVIAQVQVAQVSQEIGVGFKVKINVKAAGDPLASVWVLFLILSVVT